MSSGFFGGVFLDQGPRDGTCLLLAHGAGAPMDSDWMEDMTSALAARGLFVRRFEFPYMAARRGVDGKRRGPDRAPKLEACYREAVAACAGELGRPAAQLVIGGKSMGGRMATHVADELEVGATICLGYPFHPPGKPERLRTAHLAELHTPTLIVQGERDPFGTRAEIDGYELADTIELHCAVDGDHSLKPRKRSGVSLEENLQSAAAQIVRFLEVTLPSAR